MALRSLEKSTKLTNNHDSPRQSAHVTLNLLNLLTE